jgi:hypothetical protein
MARSHEKSHRMQLFQLPPHPEATAQTASGAHFALSPSALLELFFYLSPIKPRGPSLVCLVLRYPSQLLEERAQSPSDLPFHDLPPENVDLQLEPFVSVPRWHNVELLLPLPWQPVSSE